MRFRAITGRESRSVSPEALEPGKTTVRADGAGTAKTVLAVDLPEFQQMPYLTSENGDVTLSQIGIRIRNADMHCTVDEVDKLSVQLRDGSEYVILRTKKNPDIDRTLYTYGFNSTEDTGRIDTPRLPCWRVRSIWIMCSPLPSTARCIRSRDKRQDRAKQTANAVSFSLSKKSVLNQSYRAAARVK